MRQKINNMIAIMLAIIILCASSYAVVSYAADTYKSAAELESQGASTNDKNVEVDVYYAGGEHSKTVDITGTEKIYAKVAVKNAGYLENLTINFANSNFEIANDESNAGKIQSIDTKSKVVVLNKIVAGNEVEIALNISPIKADVVGTDNFKNDNTITVSGTYVNEKAKEVVISKEIAIHTSWHGEAKTKINQEIVKYIPSVLGEEVLLQTEVTTEVENSVLPVKNSEVIVDIPELAETKPTKVMVYAKTTENTNGEKTAISFNESNYSYDETNGEVVIEVANNANAEGKISWVKNAQDKYEIVMVYPKEVIAALKESTSIIQTSASITNEYYDDVDYSSNAGTTAQTPLSQKGTIADYEGGIENESIAKGYMYNGVETTYTEKYSMSTSYAGITDEMNITVDTPEFVKESRETVSSANNIYNKKVSVDIAELKKILGETGKVEIISNSKVIGTIDANTEVDSNGKATVDISAEKASSIEVKTSKPQTQGQLSVEIEKAIASDISYSLAERKSFTGVKQVATGTAKAGQTQIVAVEVTDTMNLVEPTQKILISANKQNLSVANSNEMELTALLETDSTDDSLYENPIVTITFPKEIENIEVKGMELVHSEELKIERYQIHEDENGKYLQIEMSGIQTKYNDGLVKGASIIAKISFVVNEQIESQKTVISIKPTSYLEETSINSAVEINFIKLPEKEEPMTGESDKEKINDNTQNKIENTDNEKTEKIEQNGIEIATIATVGDKNLGNGESVFEGTGIKYEITIKNNTGTNLQNFKLIAVNTNANYYDLETVKGTYQNDQGGMDENDYTRYNELLDWNQKEFETIENFGIGETKTFTYQIIVKEVEDEAETIEKIKISADGMENIETELIKNPIKQGDIKVKTQFNLLEEEILSSGVYTPVTITVTNISDKEIENAYVRCKFSDGIGIRSSGLYIKNTDDEELGYELVEIQDGGLKLKLDKLSKREERQIILYVDLLQKEKTEVESIITYIETEENNTYTSNIAERKIYQKNNIKLECSMSCNVEEDKAMTTGENIIYYINIENKDDDNQIYMSILDKVPAGVIVNSINVIIDGETTDITNDALKISDSANILFGLNLKAKQKAKIEIKTTIDAGLVTENKISNYASLEINGETLKTNTITHKTYKEGEPDPDNPDPDNPDPDNPDPDNPDPDNPDPDNPDPDNPNPDNPDPDNPDPEEPELKYYSISGKAWLDENKNSSKDPKEKVLEDIKVIIIKAETGEYLFNKDGKKIITKTNENGEYKFENVPQGKYLILFEYDSEKYEPVEYKKEGISDLDNSDVIKKQATIEGESKEVAVTDILEITEKDINNVNIGLKKKDRFDLSLDKYVSKVTVQNGAGTATHQYTNTQLAKLEIPAKYYQNSKLIIEYTITVKNEGNIAGYVNDIVDYIPEELKFNSELNEEWYLGKDNNLHNITLEDEIIKEGETKEVKLILTRTIPGEEAETISNIAEIGTSSNEYSLEDVDSTPGNKVLGEDDTSTAKIIVSIKTGETLKIISAIVVALLIAIPATIIIVKRRNENEK